MRQDNKNITVVGDDAQSIYSFRSATVRNMLDFPKQFPGTKVVTLEQNYRSIQPILETTNRVIAQAKERFSKELWTDRKSGQRPLLIACVDETDQDKPDFGQENQDVRQAGRDGGGRLVQPEERQEETRDGPLQIVGGAMGQLEQDHRQHDDHAQHDIL